LFNYDLVYSVQVGLSRQGGMGRGFGAWLAGQVSSMFSDYSVTYVSGL
jgi:hypothetical protein